MKVASLNYVQGVAYKILGEVRDGDNLSDREMAILQAGFGKLIQRLDETSDESPEVLEFLKELTVISSGLTQRAVDVCPACDGIGSKKLFGVVLNCSTCHGSGKRN